MKCPNCGIDNSNEQVYCSSCGASLYGPRSINLNSNDETKSQYKSNDIKKITGIDINDLPIGQNVVSTAPKNDKPKKKNLLSTSSLIFIFVIIILLILSIYLFTNNRRLSKTNNCPTTNKCVQLKEAKGIYGATSKFVFYLPKDFRYSESSNETILTNNNLSILLFGYENGQVDKITSETIKNRYNEDGFADALVHEDVLEQRKIIYVTFNSNNIYFADFYYQYDSEKFIYGQISSAATSEVINDTAKEILSTIVIEENQKFQVIKAPVTYSKLFELIK